MIVSYAMKIALVLSSVNGALGRQKKKFLNIIRDDGLGSQTGKDQNTKVRTDTKNDSKNKN